MLDRLWAVSLLFFNSVSSARGTKTEINKFMTSQENIILQHNIKFELFTEIKLSEHFRISKRIYLQTKFIGNSSASGPKVDFWYCN